jgi:lysozyme family protein
MTDIAALTAANARRWANARLTRSFAPVARHLISPEARSRYQIVAAKTGVPWPAIAVIHERECSQDWKGSLAQGDPWDKISVHVPAGRGPFRSWEEAAIDALNNCPPYAGRNRDWSIGALLTKLEEYNGLGYAARGVPSPYLWSGTDQYRSGKYVRDGVYDTNAVDSQFGCAGLLMAMMALDPTITPSGAAASVTPKPSPPTPSLTKPTKGSIGAWVASVLGAIFKSKGK